MGPMRAARHFVMHLEDRGRLMETAAVCVDLYGSLALTGKGHGTDRAVLLGLEGDTPEHVAVTTVDERLASIRERGELRVLGRHAIAFRELEHLRFHPTNTLPRHPNGMRFTALNDTGSTLQQGEYYSIGGGFVVTADDVDSGVPESKASAVPHPYRSADELLAAAKRGGLTIAALVLANESHACPRDIVRTRLLHLWAVMQACADRGLTTEGVLPGGLNVRRRAPRLYRRLRAETHADPLKLLDWANVYAMAVNEENAAGGRVVTAPTNGAAGVVPAVLHHYTRFCEESSDDGVCRFLLAAGAIGILYKENASISGAEVGCQGEVGVACSMAAGGLVAALGGTNEQVEHAAEVGMEHHLGMTCDPIGGLVQIPCIERNAIGAVKAINAARMSMNGDGHHHVSLDQVIETMRQTGRDMQARYKETSLGGLAVNVVEC